MGVVDGRDQSKSTMCSISDPYQVLRSKMIHWVFFVVVVVVVVLFFAVSDIFIVLATHYVA